RADGCDHFVHERHRERPEPHGRRVQSGARERFPEREELRGCLRSGYARGELGGRIVAVIAAFVRIDFEHQRRPELGRLREVLVEVGGQLEAFWHDADDLVARAVDLHRATEDTLIATESSLPEAMTEYNRAGAGAGGVFSALKATTMKRPGAENLERVRGDSPDADALRLNAAGQVDLPAFPGGNAAEAAHALPVILDFDWRDPGLVPAGPPAPDHHARAGLAVRERRKQYAAHDAEHRRRRAHPQRESEDGDGREARLANQPSHAVTDVLKEKVHRADC